MKEEIVGKLIGWVLRFGGGAAAFGIWQDSVWAGMSFLALLITIEELPK